MSQNQSTQQSKKPETPLFQYCPGDSSVHTIINRELIAIWHPIKRAWSFLTEEPVNIPYADIIEKATWGTAH